MASVITTTAPGFVPKIQRAPTSSTQPLSLPSNSRSHSHTRSLSSSSSSSSSNSTPTSNHQYTSRSCSSQPNALVASPKIIKKRCKKPHFPNQGIKHSPASNAKSCKIDLTMHPHWPSQNLPSPINIDYINENLGLPSPSTHGTLSSPPGIPCQSPIFSFLKTCPPRPKSLYPPESFPISTIASLPYAPIYLISAGQLDSVHREYLSREIENVHSGVLFPWLHGIDGLEHYSHLLYGTAKKVLIPKYRGLMIVHIDSKPSNSSSLLPSDLDSMENETQSPLACLVGSVHIDDVLVPGGTRFHDTDIQITAIYQPANCFNLRNFSTQVAKYATISDIVVVSLNSSPDNINLLHAAERIARAQTFLWEKREQTRLKSLSQIPGTGTNEVSDVTWRYSTFVLTESFSHLEKNFPHLIGINSKGNMCNRINFIERERLEMIHLTRASPIATNVFLGNTEDMNGNTGYPKYDICIEAHDFAQVPDKETLKTISTTILSSYSPHHPIHLQVASTTATVALDHHEELMKNLIQFCNWIQHMVIRWNKKILIYCADGYTETSLFALTYIMVEKGLILAEAYLDLQHGNSLYPLGKECDQLTPSPRTPYPTCMFGRSFFLHGCDLHFLKRVEPEARFAYFTRIERDQLQNRPSGLLGNPRTLCVDGSYSQSKNDLQMIQNKYSWFYAIQQFDGSFPSRILPQLYLGNLNHASNPGMLRALGITHVVSVGENPCLKRKGQLQKPISGLPSTDIPKINRQYDDDDDDDNDDEGFELYLLENLYDDGLDAISPHISSCVEFIRNAIGNGHHNETNNRVLVHCRVGVSRSATIVIAYVLSLFVPERSTPSPNVRFSPPGSVYNLTLPEAYLLVRARRLNVIIQPNLRFMYELLIYEGELQRERAHKLGHINNRPWRSMSWVELAKEVDALNKLYISD